MSKSMKRGDTGLEPELEAFLNPRKINRHAPADVRARAMARAQAIIAAGGAIGPVALRDTAVPSPAPAARTRTSIRVAVAAAIALALGAAGAVAALRNRAPHTSPTVVAVSPQPPAPVAEQRLPETLPAAATVTPQANRAARPARPTRAASDAVPFTAELGLLQRAHAAFTRGDFASALALIAQHARRFPEGQLAEQREGLRVRSLAGSGRTEEANRAAAAFAARFPRSVLLPRLDQTRP